MCLCVYKAASAHFCNRNACFQTRKQYHFYIYFRLEYRKSLIFFEKNLIFIVYVYSDFLFMRNFFFPMRLHRKKDYMFSIPFMMRTSARVALPLWEIAFFSSAVSCAAVLLYCGRKNIGSYPNPPVPAASSIFYTIVPSIVSCDMNTRSFPRYKTIAQV